MRSPELICGVDEAGRGPWAGPVCAGAVILAPDHAIAGLSDSKKLSASRRTALAREIRNGAGAFALGWASPEEIDRLNIRRATHLAMRRAVEALGESPHRALIDGNDCPEGLPCPATAIIRGDATHAVISAASILAKTARDAVMLSAETEYPGYGFASHKGYGTSAHGEALMRLGPSPLHRHSFAPVAKARAAHTLST
ncbi:MAG: ribonuclease HII [Alphaproteobacteria bacterium]|jgi:ribonuclease HII|nr:ribonuclease HII [Alphaproteobacteria bacterium]